MKNNKEITKERLDNIAEVGAEIYYKGYILENGGEETLEVIEEMFDYVWTLYAPAYGIDYEFEYKDLTKANKKYLIKSLLKKYHAKCIEKIEKELNSL